MEGIGDECFNEGVFLVLVCACAGNISSFGGSENMGAVAIRRIRGGMRTDERGGRSGKDIL